MRFRSGTKWTFNTKRFAVVLECQRDNSYQYDGDDENGETQTALDSGEYVAFDSTVTVFIDGEEIARDSLGGSVYGAETAQEFWTAHRTSSFSGRNTLALKAQNTSICHYFPDMVRQACAQAREHIAEMKTPPHLRTAA